MSTMSAEEFVGTLPLLGDFSQALPMTDYTPIPDDWYIAVTDVVKSRQAIAQGRFKPVNMAGVAIISAVMNMLGHQKIPYMFGGDGAAIACSPAEKDIVELALSQTVGWVEDDLDLQLRASLVPVSKLREQGVDICVSAVRVSDAIINYGFSGGGVAKAEKMLKAGDFKVDRTPELQRPDLTGLSCRWTAVGEDGLKMVSLIVEPFDEEGNIPTDVLNSIVLAAQGNREEGNPMPEAGPGFKWPSTGTNLESIATGKSNWLIHFETFIAMILFKTGIKLGGFDARHYWRATSLNTDYRKIQDGLRMTVSLKPEEIPSLRELLENYRERKIIRYGICEQDKAVLTCFVPSITSDSHYHFLDGSGGGYAAAADDLH